MYDIFRRRGYPGGNSLVEESAARSRRIPDWPASFTR
jgi:hypothetical protein